MTVHPRVYVDWDDDGTFTGTGENVSDRVYARPGITTARGRDQVRSLTPPAAGISHAVLDNVSRDYSPENTDSPLDGSLHPGHFVRATVFVGTEDTYDSETLYDSDALYDGAPAYHIATTLLDDLPQNPAIGVQTVDIPAIGVFSRLVGKRVTTPLYQSILISDAIGYVLDAVEWPASDRRISPSSTTLDWWWLDDQDAWSALQTLYFSEGPGAALYEDADGYFVFEDKTYRITEDRCTTSQLTLAATDTNPPIAGMVYQAGLKDIINQCSVRYESRLVPLSATTICSLAASLTLAPSESRSFVARADTGDPFTGAITPVEGVDYAVNSGSIASVTLNRTSGAQVRVTITAGGGGATISGLSLRAKPVAVGDSGSVSNTVSATTSISRYGLRPFSYETWPCIATNILQDLVNTIVNTHSVPQPMVRVTAIGYDDAGIVAILNRQISDRISVADPTSGFASDVFIEHIALEITSPGKVVAVFGCTKSGATGYGVWDTGEWDSAIWAY